MRGLKLNIPLAALAAIIPSVAASCDREALLSSVGDYVMAQDMGLAGALRNVAHDFQYFENNKSKEIAAGTTFKGQKLVYNRTIIDMTACATATEMIGWQQVSPLLSQSPFLASLGGSVPSLHPNPL